MNKFLKNRVFSLVIGFSLLGLCNTQAFAMNEDLEFNGFDLNHGFLLRKNSRPLRAPRGKSVCPTDQPDVHVVQDGELEVTEYLGGGHFGEVSRARFQGADVILKVLKTTKNSRGQPVSPSLNSIRVEISRQKTASEVGVAPEIIGDVLCINNDDGFQLGFMMEPIDHSIDFKKFIDGIKGIADFSKKLVNLEEFLMQSFSQLKKLHEKGISHNDLAPENILVILNPVDPTLIVGVKFLDFGFIGYVGHPEYQAKNHLKYSKYNGDLILLLNISLDTAIKWSLLDNYRVNSNEKPEFQTSLSKLRELELRSQVSSQVEEFLQGISPEIESNKFVDSSDDEGTSVNTSSVIFSSSSIFP